MPVLETESLLAWDATTVDDQSQKQQSQDRNDLDRSEDKLCFTVDGHSEDVQREHDYDNEGDPSGHIDGLGTWPVLDDGGSGGNLSAESDGIGIPVVPTHGETHGIIDVACAKLGDGTRQREPCGHFTERYLRACQHQSCA